MARAVQRERVHHRERPDADHPRCHGRQHLAARLEGRIAGLHPDPPARSRLHPRLSAVLETQVGHAATTPYNAAKTPYHRPTGPPYVAARWRARAGLERGTIQTRTNVRCCDRLALR